MRAPWRRAPLRPRYARRAARTPAASGFTGAMRHDGRTWRRSRVASGEHGVDPEHGQQGAGVRDERRRRVGEGGGHGIRGLPPRLGHLAVLEPDVAVPDRSVDEAEIPGVLVAVPGRPDAAQRRAGDPRLLGELADGGVVRFLARQHDAAERAVVQPRVDVLRLRPPVQQHLAGGAADDDARGRVREVLPAPPVPGRGPAGTTRSVVERDAPLPAHATARRRASTRAASRHPRTNSAKNVVATTTNDTGVPPPARRRSPMPISTVPAVTTAPAASESGGRRGSTTTASPTSVPVTNGQAVATVPATADPRRASAARAGRTRRRRAGPRPARRDGSARFHRPTGRDARRAQPGARRPLRPGRAGRLLIGGGDEHAVAAGAFGAVERRVRALEELLG